MRQDIVDVLKTSHMDLVRALIGQPPFALHCWKKAHMMLRAVAAFRLADFSPYWQKGWLSNSGIEHYK